MQEEVESRSMTLIISSAKLNARVLRAAIAKYLAHRKDKKITKARAGPVVPHGKQTVKELVGQNAGVSNLEITDSNIKSFDRVARKYGVDYAVKKDRSVSPPKYVVFFKGRDADALTAAFTEFTAKTMDRAKKPSVLSRLQQFKELVKANTIDRVRHKEQERTR
ncbi:MAG: PcfB family protein [Ruminococcaceae bacterium]|nr:PcfB family protein [Oscillospiraceae bacterium]